VADPQAILDPLQVPQNVKADAWDAFHSAADQADFQKRFDSLNIPKEAKAALWDAKFQLTPPEGYVPSKQDLPADLPQQVGRGILNYLPAIGATAATVLAPEATVPAWIASGLGGAGGSVLQQGIKRLAGEPDAPASIPEAINRAGTEGAEMGASELGGRFVNAALGRIFKRVMNPTQLYQSALKPSTALGVDETKKIVGAGLKEGIPVNPEKWDTGWQKLNSQIDSIIGGGPQQKPIDPKLVAQKLDDLKVKWSSGSGDPAYAKAIDDVKQNFLIRYPRPIPPTQAQEVKKQIYKEIRNAKGNYFTSDAAPISLDAKEELASALKLELEQRYPEIGDLNRREGAMIGLEKALGRFAAREGNKQISPYFIFPIVGGLLGSQGGVEGAGAGAGIGALGAHLVRSAFEDPEVKSKLAIALFRAGNIPGAKAISAVAPYVPGTAIRLGADALNAPPMPPR